MIPERKTRTIHVRDLAIGGNAPIAIQSMAATRTVDIDATMEQVRLIDEAGADLIRIAADTPADVEALKIIRANTSARLSVDLQENYRLAEQVAPLVDKIRYNPGHLHHHERTRSIADKVAYLADIAGANNCAIRIGVNAGSVAPDYVAKFPATDEGHASAIVASAVDHCALLDNLEFTNYVVSIKDSDPRVVIETNTRFATARPDVPLHLGVTEAGMPPDGIIKTRIAFEQLLSQGIGDTLRVSLTVPFKDKGLEIQTGRQLVADIQAGRFRSVPKGFFDGLNIIACPSCSRVENEAFIDLAQDVKRITKDALEENITIAVMGCRVNGPGETDDADIGLWCGPKKVNLKRGTETLGAYGYGEILDRVREEFDRQVAERSA